MLNTASPNQHLLPLLAAAFCFSCINLSANDDASKLELASPKNDDHFEVTKPLFFWQTDPQAKSYSLVIDDTPVAEIPAQTIPVMHFGLTTALPPGLHHWLVKETTTSGSQNTSDSSSFTIDPPLENWPDWAIGPFQRYGKNPVISPQGTTWESVNTCNPGVLFDQGEFRMLYRAQGKPWTSRVGYAESPDGVSFTRNPDPVINVTDPSEQRSGCEDARFLKYQGTYYAFYAGPGGESEATSPDGLTWTKLGPIGAKTKNAGVVCDPNGVPVKINGKFAMFIGDSWFNVCYSDDLIHWGPLTKIDMKFPKGWGAPFEPCIAITDYSSTQPDNVVLFIAGTLNGKGKWFYAISEVLFSKKDLTTKVAQLDDCIMKPREPYESGQNKDCLWMHCIIQHDQQWWMYYGAGDRNVALATAPVK